MGTGGPLKKSPKFRLRFQVMVAEVRVRSGFTEVPQLSLELCFQTAGEEVRLGSPLLQMRGEVKAPPSLKFFSDEEIEGCNF